MFAAADRTNDPSAPPRTPRQLWMAVLAKARPDELERAWAEVPDKPDYRLLRRPEVGMAMLRGRAGGRGQPFNFGEMTVTRCAVQLDDGTVGQSYVGGRRLRQAEIAAVADALLQQPARNAALQRLLVEPLRQAALARRQQVAAKVAASKVEFFTVARETGS